MFCASIILPITLPSLDQRAAVDIVVTDAQAAVAALNRTVTADLPAAYNAAKKT